MLSTEGMKSEPLTTKPSKQAASRTIRESCSRSEIIIGSRKITGINRWDSHDQETLKTRGKNLHIRVGEGGGYV